MIDRLHGRSMFTRLREQGVRVRAGWLWCSMVIDPSAERAHVGFAIGRAYGSAVDRNRLRRRLRVALHSQAHRLPAGWYLVGVSPRGARPTWSEVVEATDRLSRAVQVKATTA